MDNYGRGQNDNYNAYSDDNDGWNLSNNNLESYSRSVKLEEERSLSEKLTKSLVVRTYVYMFAVLILSGITAYSTYTSGLFDTLIENGVMLPLLLSELLIVWIATKVMNSQNVVGSAIMLLIYSAVNGITLSFIFKVYTSGSICAIFFIAAAMFGVMAVYGSLTSTDLTSIGNLGMMILIGVIIASFVNMFILHSSTFDLFISIIAVAVFIGLTAYDAQKIKQRAKTIGDSEKTINSVAMFCALGLYLDFINLFLRLLRIFGRRR